MDITPITYLIKRMLGFSAKKLCDIPKRTEILCPEEQQEIRPAIFLKDNFNLVTGYAPTTVQDYFNRILYGGKVTHCPTILFEIDHIKFLNGTFYKNMFKYPIISGKTKKIIFSKPEYINKAAFVSTWYGTTYFGHWLADDLPQVLLGKKYADVYGYYEKPYFHSKEYLELFNLHIPLTSHAIFDKVILFQDCGFNSSKKSRYLELRKNIKNSVNNKINNLSTYYPQLSNKSNNKRFYVRRGNTGAKRTITNEAEIQKYLESIGFIVIEPENMTPTELIGITLDASIIIGCEGSHMAHFMYSIAPNGCMISLTPCDRVSIALKEPADCIGYYYGLVIGKKEADGFSIKISDLDKVIELYNSKTPCYAELNG